jgi:hypothetical protein
MYPMKFSIRDLLLATMIVALSLGWWVDHWRLSSRITEIERKDGISQLELERAVYSLLLMTRGVTVDFRMHKDKPLVKEKDGTTWEFEGSF